MTNLSARRGALGLPLLLVAVAGLAIAAYLLIVRIIGEPPVCGPSAGCELVQQSKYATFLGVPVAAWGTAFSLVLVALAARWWRAADRRALTLAYLLLLAGALGVAVLTYLELFVIHAICLWCVGYAIAMVASLLTAGIALRRS
ncbi:MAG: vitamin K epoxide reductase family protein [Chloroflexota bacterium]